MDCFGEDMETLKEALQVFYNEWPVTSLELWELGELFSTVYGRDDSQPGQSLSDSLNFTDENMRRYYVFRYVIGHVLCLCLTLKKALLESFAFVTWTRKKKSRKLSFCCFGGGPGTELFAFKFFFQKLQEILKNPETEPEMYNELKATGLFRMSVNRTNHMPVIAAAEVLEKYTFWEPTFQRLNAEIPLPLPIPNVTYSEYDFGMGFADNQDPRLQRLIEADVITMVKFCSSILCSESIPYETVEVKLKEIVEHVKPGALLFYCDVLSPEVLKPLSETVEQNCFRLIFNYDITTENPKFSFGGISLPHSTTIQCVIWEKM